jgi:hypothetical protein
MISLKEAAAIFNKTIFTDINSENAFEAQVLPFNDSLRSGETSRRRIMETAPEIAVPDVVIQVETGEVFLTAKESVDFFRDYVVRTKRPIIPTDGNYAVKTVEQILDSSAGVTEWGTIHYTRREVLSDSSDYLGGYTAMLPSSAPVTAGTYLVNGANYYRASSDSHIDEFGFAVTELVNIPSALQTLDITVKGVYDPVTETSADVTTSSLCVVEERLKSFENTRMDYVKIEDGDYTVNTLHPCEVGDTVGVFSVVHKYLDGAVNVLHCRRS